MSELEVVGGIAHPTDADEEQPSQPPAVMQGLLALQKDPYRSGRATNYPPEVIDRALLETAAVGGSATKASKIMSELGTPVPAKRITIWRTGRFRERYEQISEQMAPYLREKVAREALEFTQEAQEAQGKALRQVLSGLSDANAVEASVILRNISGAQQTAVQTEASMRGRAGMTIEVVGLDELASKLVKLGVGSYVDSTAEEDDAQAA